MTTETRTAYPEDAAPEIVDALNATGEVRARLVDDTIIEVGRKLSRGWQNMGRVELGTDGDEDGNEWITIEELPTLRRSWVESQVSTVIDRHNG